MTDASAAPARRGRAGSAGVRTSADPMPSNRSTDADAPVVPSARGVMGISRTLKAVKAMRGLIRRQSTINSHAMRVRLEYDAFQLKTFTRWWRSTLMLHPTRHSDIRDLYEEIQASLPLVYLLEVLTSESVPKITFPRGVKPLNRFARLENFRICLDFIASKKCDLVNIHAEGLSRGDHTQVLGMTWELFQFFEVKVSKADLLAWVNSCIDRSIDTTLGHITSWEAHFSDGRVFAAILDSRRPGCFLAQLPPGGLGAEALLELTFRTALKRGTPRLLDVQDLAGNAKADANSIVAYVAKLRQALGAPGAAVTMQKYARRYLVRRGVGRDVPLPRAGAPGAPAKARAATAAAADAAPPPDAAATASGTAASSTSSTTPSTMAPPSSMTPAAAVSNEVPPGVAQASAPTAAPAASSAAAPAPLAVPPNAAPAAPAASSTAAPAPSAAPPTGSTGSTSCTARRCTPAAAPPAAAPSTAAPAAPPTAAPSVPVAAAPDTLAAAPRLRSVGWKGVQFAARPPAFDRERAVWRRLQVRAAALEAGRRGGSKGGGGGRRISGHNRGNGGGSGSGRGGGGGRCCRRGWGRRRSGSAEEESGRREVGCCCCGTGGDGQLVINGGGRASAGGPGFRRWRLRCGHL